MPYTMRQYMSEIQQRLDRYTVASRIDSGMLETMVNKARHDVQLATLQTMPERYARIHVLTNAAVASIEESARCYIYDQNLNTAVPTIMQVGVFDLPEDFIEAVVVAYRDEDDVLWPARKVEKRELYTTLTRSFTRPTPNDPIYSVERLTGSSTYRLLVSIGEDLALANTVEVWYLAKLPYLDAAGVGNTDDQEVRIGFDLQELVINIVLMRLLVMLRLPVAAESIAELVSMMVSAVQRQYEVSIDRSGLLLQARETNVPNQYAAEGNS
jgi:hypothetical protein